MAVRLIKVITSVSILDELEKAIRDTGIIDVWKTVDLGKNITFLSILTQLSITQEIIDIVQTHLGKETRIIIQEVEATVPRHEEEEKSKFSNSDGLATKLFKCCSISREELYEGVAANSKISVNYIVMVLLAALVATLGILYQNFAVIIGGMLIAPLLGPNLGVALGTALGNYQLIRAAIRSNLIGLGCSVVFAYIVGLIWFPVLGHPVFTTHLHVGFDSIILALASGAAAVVTLLSGVSSNLVGVMVAVALLPPAAEIGLGLSMSYYAFSLNSLLLLAINIVSITLAANVMFILSGVRPSFWQEKQKARRASHVLIFSLIMMLFFLMGMVYLRVKYWP